MPKKEATVTGLPAMMGSPFDFVAQSKTYGVKPLKVKDNDEFNALNFGSQYFTLNDPAEIKKMDKFMERYLFDTEGEPMTVEKTGTDDWDILDLKNFLKKVIDISG